MNSELLFQHRGALPVPSPRSGTLSSMTPVHLWTYFLTSLRYGLLLLLFQVSLTSFAFENPTTVPALASDKASTGPLTAVTKVGDRLVAVGQRGHILVSDDDGLSWLQASVPVSSDLVAVAFASDTHGWAVGHSGVVLKTEDGGLSWVLQLDGERASRVIQQYYQSLIGDDAHPDAALLLEREQVLVGYGGTQPLMDVYFEDEQNGYVVGIFNRLLKTSDGGATWEPWAHRIDNPHELHFYSISVGDDGLYITGEQGMVWRLNEEKSHFNGVPTPYSGTLFGSAVGSDMVVAFGMRGSAYLSTDQGQTWVRLAIDSVAGITDGVIVSQGAIVLVNLAGELMVSIDQGESFQTQPITNGMPFYGLAQVSDSQLALVGAEGVQRLAVTTADPADGESSVSVFSASSIVQNSVEYRHVK